MSNVAGFLVYEVTADTNVKDLLYIKRVLYESWDTAVNAASALANAINARGGGKLLSVLRADSERTCIKRESIVSHTFGGTNYIMIFTVFRAT